RFTAGELRRATGAGARGGGHAAGGADAPVVEAPLQGVSGRLVHAARLPGGPRGALRGELPPPRPAPGAPAPLPRLPVGPPLTAAHARLDMEISDIAVTTVMTVMSRRDRRERPHPAARG